MSAPDWAALVQQTRDRIDQAEKEAKADRGLWMLMRRMAAWARDVLDRHIVDHEGYCDHCCEDWPCPDLLSVPRAWVPDLLAAAGVES